MEKYSASIATILTLAVTVISPAAADVSAIFTNDSPTQACVEYSYILRAADLTFEHHRDRLFNE